MARYKVVDRSPRFLPVVLDAQLMPGSFEYALDYLIDNELDLSGLDSRYNNDATGAPAYDPAVMLKIVLLAYSRGMVSSGLIEQACRENVLFMALSGDSAPQFTTITKFIRELGPDIAALFTQVLITCDARGLIGHHQVHLVKKHAFARALGDKLETCGGKADLFHKRSVTQSKLSVLGFADIP